MRPLVKILNSLILVIVLISSVAAETPEKKPDLNALADDRRFSDAANFVKLGRDDRAISLLYEYLEIFDNGTHRDEAWRHIAEIYSRRFQYARAAEIYLRLYSEFSHSEQGIAAYYQAALCYMKMGMNSRAESIFKDIIQRAPDSPHAAQAATRIEILKLTGNK
jgi:TolA-binding protein